ncbi:DUF171-domain-containing protein [Patellaria atrata CBS 101060]|uniref:DUF171-domain-containing protein n=1 Tax=Patellaria atrata CBS 101060 TaxID=1346257 RepID=A0A9P4S120_9PEZI|nr:DUF171-domain-containing protein [Patellaria atrata CBS 101060]
MMKRKYEQHEHEHEQLNTSKPSAFFKPVAGRKHTLTVALPGSIIANAQNHDLKTYLAGKIGRALAVFCVDEIVIFDDGQRQNHRQAQNRTHQSRRHDDNDDEYSGWSDPDHFLEHLLSYLECPPHLRKSLFPMHPNLSQAGKLPSLDMPHHLRSDEWCPYREGITVDQGSADSSEIKKRKPSNITAGNTTLVDAGFPSLVRLEPPPLASIPVNTRLTLKFRSETDPGIYTNLTAEAVGPDTPREEKGYYWGYSIRRASGIHAVFSECPYFNGYSFSIGTSERGQPIDTCISRLCGLAKQNEMGGEPVFKNVLIVFGGVAGLEAAVKFDSENLAEISIGRDNPTELFDLWVNLQPTQGSRTIRTEEAVWLGLAKLEGLVRM